ncbi:aminotransferase class I/II-fold pyridoxal phosphate-dependent enzyme [Labilibacter marinus]|uniref:aminotransferase class I/II-fold pyridoxal phosphate-dependent enzyme n=1 Tax=Labilibacter marinus TaxID=1477105 RepID=UPI00082E1D28|nr:aminotransferase class I/II-fold pyridoxal phosphate-dependent enzyme [Labilibacter marinus]
MISLNLENITSPKAIVEYARESSCLNLAESHSEMSCNKELEDLVSKYILPYANMSSPKFGLPDLRNAIASKIEKLYDHSYNSDTELTITAGVKQSVFCTILALLKEGDEVLVFEPAHKSYEEAIKLAGARPVYVSLEAPKFVVNWEDVQKLITTKTRMIIVNSPHFPSGSTMSELDMIRLQKILNGTNIVVVSDESFEHMVFDAEMHQSVALYPLLRERSVIVSSFNETLNIPNWHIGYCIASEKLMKQIRKVVSIVGEGINLPYQMAIADYLKDHSNFSELSTFYQKKRDLFFFHIEDSKVKAIPCKGSYFQLITIEGVADKTDLALAIRLMEEQNLATVPISFYYHENSKKKYLRVNISVADEVLVEAASRLKKV